MSSVLRYQEASSKHRGFAFVTFASAEDAQDAIDNMDMNEMGGRVLKVSLARPMKTPAQLGGNRAGQSNIIMHRIIVNLIHRYSLGV